MTVLKRISALLLALAVVLPAAAQFSFGPRVGVNINSLSFNEDVLSSDNRAGFTGGLQAEFMIPMLNFGVDASVMYVHRSSDVLVDNNTVDGDASCDYIEIPINLKYKFGLPGVGKIVAPYIFTGPSFAFRTSKDDLAAFYNDQTCDISWNVGVGVQLFSHLQVGASYGFGLNKVVEITNISDHATANIEGKNKYWTITAAWLF